MAVSRWASSPGRTIFTGVVAAIVITLAGTAVYVAALSLLFGAALASAGGRDAGATTMVLEGTSVVALVLEVLVVSLAGAVTSVLTTRTATASPRWWPPLLAGLVACAAYWGLALAGASGDEVVALFMWPTHLESWMWVVIAQVIAVNLGARTP